MFERQPVTVTFVNVLAFVGQDDVDLNEMCARQTRRRRWPLNATGIVRKRIKLAED